MSTLIKELEARKNDYIVVADVISVMAGATNSTASEVVDYLEAHGVNAHLPIFYMDDYYSFNPIDEWLCQVGENDAKTTYFRASDVMSFEPITKHGIFNDKPATVVNDVYGRTYDINQHKKNREDDYLTLGETLDFLNYRRETGTSSYDHVKLRDTARRKLITPCFYFDGYVGSFRGDRGDSDNGFYTEVVAGYFTYRSLAEEICRYDDHMKLPNDGVMIYSVLEKKTAEFVDYDDVFLFYDKPQGLDEAEKFRLTHIDAEEIRFSKRALDSYIDSIANNSQDETPAQNDSELLAKLESAQTDNDKLNARLNKASEIYRQNKSKIEELEAQLEKASADSAELKKQLSKANATLADMPADESILQTILDESRGDHAPDLKHAIQLWIDLYIHGGIKDDSHSSKANIWIRSNTNYAENANSSIGRIREIATPLKDFGAKRSREEEK